MLRKVGVYYSQPSILTYFRKRLSKLNQSKFKDYVGQPYQNIMYAVMVYHVQKFINENLCLN